MKNDVIINPNERVDDLQCKGRLLIQNLDNFCFGVDAVLLSNFATVKEDEKALDLCTGTGIVPILLSAKNCGDKYIGMEIQGHMVEMANRSVALNGICDKVEIVEKDLKEFDLSYGKFNVVTVNPPYIAYGGGMVNGDYKKAVARHEIACTLEDVVSTAKKALLPRGRFYMVHRPNRLTDIMNITRKYSLEPKRIQFVQPYENKEPNIMLIECCAGGKSMVKVEPSLIVYKENGEYTDIMHELCYSQKDEIVENKIQ